MSKTKTLVVVSRNEDIIFEITDGDFVECNTKESMLSYAGIFSITLNNKSGKFTDQFKNKDEISIFRIVDSKKNKIFGGYLDEEIIQVEKQGEKIELVLNGRSYSSYILDTIINGKIIYKKGIEEILTIILKESGYTYNISNIPIEGIMILNDIPVIEVIRQLAELSGYVFKINRDKEFYFGPEFPSKHAGTITEKDILSLKSVKKWE